MSEAGGLIERERSCLVVIDVQQYFLDKLSLEWRAPLVERIAWLMRTAGLLDIPSSPPPRTWSAMAAGARAGPPPAGRRPCRLQQDGLRLWGQEDIRAAVEATGRDCFVLTGLETDVCVAQSALGLRAAGYRVAVVSDACASPPPNHEHGLQRLQGSGVVLTSVKTVFYEWVRDLETTHRIRAELDVPYPAGVTF